MSEGVLQVDHPVNAERAAFNLQVLGGSAGVMGWIVLLAPPRRLHCTVKVVESHSGSSAKTQP
jgi:hypothetical protein